MDTWVYDAYTNIVALTSTVQDCTRSYLIILLLFVYNTCKVTKLFAVNRVFLWICFFFLRAGAADIGRVTEENDNITYYYVPPQHSCNIIVVVCTCAGGFHVKCPETVFAKPLGADQLCKRCSVAFLLLLLRRRRRWWMVAIVL